MSKTAGKDQKDDGEGQSTLQEAEPEIIATGDAILVARALDNIADALRYFADKIGELNQGNGNDDDNPPETYLDGTRRTR